MNSRTTLDNRVRLLEIRVAVLERLKADVQSLQEDMDRIESTLRQRLKEEADARDLQTLVDQAEEIIMDEEEGDARL